VTGDGWLSPDDVSSLVSVLLPYASTYYSAGAPEGSCGDINGDGWLSPGDISSLVSDLLPHASNSYWVKCPDVILLDVYSCGDFERHGEFLQTLVMEEEGEITISVGGADSYYVYAKKQGFYTELYHCSNGGDHQCRSGSGCSGDIQRYGIQAPLV